MEFDLLIRNGLVVDGSGRTPARIQDVGVRDGRIAAVDRLDGANARTVIDAAGKVVAPGFIDVHVHSEIALLGGRDRYGSLLQGVTTHLTAPDGFGWAPLPPDRARALWENTLFSHGEADLSLDWPTAESYLSIFAGRLPLNLVPQVPHCAIRMAVMGWENRPATDAELAQMKVLTREWMEAGAVALCLGLDYQPSAFADTRELVELSRVAREYGGIYAAHLRYSDLGAEGAWREIMQIGREANIPVHVSHESVTDVTEPLLEEAAATCDLTFESYLYPAGCTHLAMMLPVWAQAGGPAGILRRVRDPQYRDQLRNHLETVLSNGIRDGARAVFVANQTGRYLGMSIAEAAAAENRPVGEFALDMLEQENPYSLMIYHRPGAPEQHLRTALRTARHPRMLVASDGVYHGPLIHPRGYGCFAQILRLCVREQKAITLEQAIHKMAGLPAERFGIRDRGLLRAGYGADLVVFDPATIADKATWTDPRREPEGIDQVFVNGRAVVANGVPTGELPGRVLRPLS